MHIFHAVDCKIKQPAKIDGIKVQINNFNGYKRPISQMRMLPEAFLELEWDYNRLAELLYVFEHKTEYLLILCSLYTRIVVFWNFSNILLTSS